MDTNFTNKPLILTLNATDIVALVSAASQGDRDATRHMLELDAWNDANCLSAQTLTYWTRVEADGVDASTEGLDTLACYDFDSMDHEAYSSEFASSWSHYLPRVGYPETYATRASAIVDSEHDTAWFVADELGYTEFCALFEMPDHDWSDDDASLDSVCLSKWLASEMQGETLACEFVACTHARVLADALVMAHTLYRNTMRRERVGEVRSFVQAYASSSTTRSVRLAMALVWTWLEEATPLGHFHCQALLWNALSWRLALPQWVAQDTA